jgi:hypothetical protein
LRRPNCRRLAAKTLVSIGVVFGICGIWPADLARADGQLPSPITAQFVAAGRSNGPVLYLGGTTYSAAPSSYRINSGPTVPAFSLRLAGEANPSDVLSAIRARDYGTIPGANQATYLAANHSMLGKPLQSKAELAAVQLAIWWFTDSIPLTRTSIPNAKFRGRARRLVAAARGKQGPDLPSSLGVRAFTIGGDLQNERVQLQVRSDDIEDTFNTFQDIDVRVGDDFATVSTGTVTLLDISAPRPTPHRIPISILPRYLTEQGALTLLVPHQSGVTHLEFGWGATLDPGVLFGPSGSSPAVVTATSFHLRFVTDYFTHPPGVTELINFGQQGLIAHLPRNRVFALTIFLFLVAIAAKLADLVIAVLKRLFGFVRARAQRRRASADTGD